VVWPDEDETSTFAWAAFLASRMGASVMRVGYPDAPGERFEIELVEPDGSRARRTDASSDEEIATFGDRLLGTSRGDVLRRAWRRAYREPGQFSIYPLTEVVRVAPKTVRRRHPPQHGVFGFSGVRPAPRSVDFVSWRLAVPRDVVAMCVLGRRIVQDTDPALETLRRWFEFLAAAAGPSGCAERSLTLFAPERERDPWKLSPEAWKERPLTRTLDATELALDRLGLLRERFRRRDSIVPHEIGGLALLSDAVDGRDATHLGIWLNLERVDGELGARFRTMVLDSIDVLAASSDFLQGFVARWAWQTVSLFLTPFERVLGIEPSDGPTRAAHCACCLRGAGETVWLGPALRARVEVSAPPKTIETSALGASVRVHTAEEHLDDLLHWLGPTMRVARQGAERLA
jgi:hypothetical protein